jgi:hypothetical protein
LPGFLIGQARGSKCKLCLCSEKNSRDQRAAVWARIFMLIARIASILIG